MNTNIQLFLTLSLVFVSLLSFGVFFCNGFFCFENAYSQEINDHISDANSTLYQNDTYGIQFQAPYNWDKTEIISDKIVDIEFVSQEKISSLPAATIGIVIEKNLPSNFTLDKYTQKTDESIHAMLGNFNLTSSSSNILAGNPANERILSLDGPRGTNLIVTQIYTLNNNNAYVITYTSQAQVFAKYLPMAQKIFSTFSILN
jgi:eukaryotic-like serine/threonine-protein kinase